MESYDDDAGSILLQAPFWSRLNDEQRQSISSRSDLITFKKNQIITCANSGCTGLVFVVRGGIRAALLSDGGRELTLFHLGPGECCVTTASCVIRQITFDTVVTASEDSVLLVIPVDLVSNLLNNNIYFRAYVYELETERFSQVIWVIQELLFRRFDQRLADYLLQEYETHGTAELNLTQEEIAREVNSSREVVTRMLHHFARQGLVELGRSHILLLDIPGLKALL